MKKKGFTIAEVFIALIIIAVMTIMLFPSIQSSSPDQNKIMFRKTFNTLSQAVSNMSFDDVNYPESQTGTDSNSNTVMRGFNYTTATTNKDATNTYNKFCYFFFDQLNTVSGGSTSCPLDSGTSTTAANILATKTVSSDGVIWYMYIPYDDSTATSTFTTSSSETTAWPLSFSIYNTKIIMDVNNSSNSTNCTQDTNGASFLPTGYSVGDSTTCAKPDTFIVSVRYDGKLQMGCTANSGAVCSTATDANAQTYLSNSTDNT